MTRKWTDLAQGPSNANTNEEREERESSEEMESVKRLTRPPPEAPARQLAAREVQRAAASRRVLVSVASKPHPSRYSERCSR